MAKFQIVKHHKSNGKKRMTICNYGYFRERGEWEAIYINLRPFKYGLWIYRHKSYKSGWPVGCGG